MKSIVGFFYGNNSTPNDSYCDLWRYWTTRKHTKKRLQRMQILSKIIDNLSTSRGRRITRRSETTHDHVACNILYMTCLGRKIKVLGGVTNNYSWKPVVTYKYSNE